MHNDEKFTTCVASTQFSKFCIDYCVPFTKKFPTINPGSPSEEEGERHVGVASPSYKPAIKFPETKVFTYKQRFADNYTELPFPI